MGQIQGFLRIFQVGEEVVLLPVQFLERLVLDETRPIFLGEDRVLQEMLDKRPIFLGFGMLESSEDKEHLEKNSGPQETSFDGWLLDQRQNDEGSQSRELEEEKEGFDFPDGEEKSCFGGEKKKGHSPPRGIPSGQAEEKCINKKEAAGDTQD